MNAKMGLDGMKTRAEALARLNTRDLAARVLEHGDEYTLLANVEADHRRLIAALEAVESVLLRMDDSRSGESRTNRYDSGIDTGFEIAADAIRYAITEALQ